jgi:ABC-2 type transport system permease protein
MKRYLRLYAYFLRFSFSRAFEFRLDFWFRVVMDCVFYVVNLAFFRVLYAHTETVGGWTLDQATVFIAGFFLVDALHMTFFSNNMWWFPILVNKGDLDYYLVRPVSSLFFVSLREFAANSFVNLLIAAGIVAWAIGRYPGGLGAAEVVSFAILIAVGSFLYYCLHMLFLMPVFWFHSNRGLAMVFYSIAKLAERPDRIYSGLTRMVLLTALPLALVASVPTEVLFGGLTAERALHIAAVVAGLFGLVALVWSRGLRAYASASS